MRLKEDIFRQKYKYKYKGFGVFLTLLEKVFIKKHGFKQELIDRFITLDEAFKSPHNSKGPIQNSNNYPFLEDLELQFQSAETKLYSCNLNF